MIPLLRTAGWALALSAAFWGGAGSALADTLDLSRYERTFTEDFDTLSVSPWGETKSRWIAHTPWAGDFGDARFADPTPDFPFTLQEGLLRIEARKGSDGKWSSGLLSAVNPKNEGFSQQYGYFEARMKLPAGKGVWPAFWLIGTDRSKGTSELDVIEYYGHADDRFHSVWHIWGAQAGGVDSGDQQITSVPSGSLTSAFHTYGVDVSEEKVTFYFDREQIWQIDTPEEFKMPFYPLVNLALGSGWPIDETPDPSFLWVDYVHVYKRKPMD